MRRGIVCLFALLAFLQSCSTGRKLSAIRASEIIPAMSIADDISPEEMRIDIPQRDTLVVTDPQGREVLIMRAIKDDNGEMVATEELYPAFVSASFKNIAERHGMVDLRFRISVPSSMQDTRWQIRLIPRLSMCGSQQELESVIVTGKEYRNAQLKGYEHYEAYLNAILTNPDDFLWDRELRIFMSRNAAFSDSVARAHYTDRLKVLINEKRIEGIDAAYHRFVKVPVSTDGVRLDTVISDDTGMLEYEYTQTIPAVPQLKKAVVALFGSIYDSDREIYRIIPRDSLTFYISSLTSLADTPPDDASMIYVEGVRALTNRDYEAAVTLLKGYSDFNAALAYASMDYNASAMKILMKLDSTPKVEYLKAVIYSRSDDERAAVQSYLNACALDGTYVHRGNLDPEISRLIKKYKLNDNENF